MKRSQLLGLGAVLGVGLGVGYFFLPGVPGGAESATAQGVDWQQLSVSEALAVARTRDQRVFVKFDAEWCSYCRALSEEVLETADGARLTQNVIAISVDFDAEENRSFVEQYVVLGLPTSLVLSPEGTQVARIQGYHGRDEWMSELEAGLSATDPVPSLRERHANAPDDAEATLRLGEALLVRGESDEGEALLERAMWISDGDAEAREVGAEALFILGRYHHRVRRDPRTSRHLWRELAARHPESAWAGGAWWWYAKAQAEIGQTALGLEVLRARATAEPEASGPVSQWAEYVVTHSLLEERAAALEALRPLVDEAEGEDREELMTLARQLDELGDSAD